MPDTRISDLTAATSVAGTDVYPSVQTAGVGPVKTSLTQITAFALANAPAGAVATPSIAPTGDTNTGFWFPAADTIAASTGGSERLRINSAGNVGIGTTSPSTTLDVRAAQATFGLTSTTTTNAAYSSFNNAGGIFYAGIDNSGGSAFSGTAYSSVLWSTAATPMVFATNGSEKMRITSAGNVGIGTTSPASKLHVFYTSTDPVISSLSGAGLNIHGSSSVRLASGTYSASPFAAWVQASNAVDTTFPLSLQPLGGKVLIGTGSTTLTAAKLEISDGTFTFVEGYLASSLVYQGSTTNHGLAFLTNNATSMVLDTNKNLDVYGDKIRVRTAKTPASASDTGNAGDICWDSSYIYVCTATNTWKRVAIATWP